jgi:hypothetical protein
MALADPQSVTIGSAVSLPRIGQSIDSGVFQSADGLVTATVSHSKTNGKRRRTVVRLDHRKIAPTPFDSSVNAEYSMSTYTVIDWPSVGYTVAEAKQVVDGLTNYLLSGTPSITSKVLGREA